MIKLQTPAPAVQTPATDPAPTRRVTIAPGLSPDGYHGWWVLVHDAGRFVAREFSDLLGDAESYAAFKRAQDPAADPMSHLWAGPSAPQGEEREAPAGPADLFDLPEDVTAEDRAWWGGFSREADDLPGGDWVARLLDRLEWEASEEAREARGHDFGPEDDLAEAERVRVLGHRAYP